MKALEIGARGTATMQVTPKNTAEAWGSGDVPVFGTPSLVALLETAAVNALKGHLESGETTVGTWIDISHLAASPVGVVVSAEAVLTGVEGRKLMFAVVAHDPRQKVGEGRHHRVIVSRQRFLEKTTA
jgi:fluoroacetyl-CoA thioesterase